MNGDENLNLNSFYEHMKCNQSQMEENNPQQNFSQLCKMGCGYFGSSNFDGLCSQCYKDKEKQFENNHTLNSTNYPAYSEKEKEFNDVQDSLISDIETESLISSTKASLATSSSTSSFNSLVTGDTNKSDILNSESNTVTSANSVKKNRCQLCRKKVGLTGFMCRCGGMFCCAHRYSDSHSCTFDYKIEAENAIRKANPRIVSNKVPKI